MHRKRAATRAWWWLPAHANASSAQTAGLNPNMNVNCMEVGGGGLSLKEPSQPQSRLSQWTHSNSTDSPSNLENNLNKHGNPISNLCGSPRCRAFRFALKCHVWLVNAASDWRTQLGPPLGAMSALGPPGKPPQLDDSYGPYNLMSASESPASPLVPPDSWAQGKSPSEKISNGTNATWPPGKDTDTQHASARRKPRLGRTNAPLFPRILPGRALEGPSEHRPGERSQRDPWQRPQRPHHQHQHP